MLKLVSFAAAAVALAAAAVAFGAPAKSTYTYKATMTPAAEVPRPSAPGKARGVFTATVTEDGGARSIRWTLTFRNLSGKAVAAHIHKGKPGVAGGVLLGLCGPCKSGQTGRATISSDVADALEQGRAYVNVHTTENTAGEIRGQAKLVKRSEAAATEPQPTPTPTPAPSPEPGGGYDPY
ncbi:MAG: CHRD domain-containing protein [Gaiellaceae bacterium]